MASAFCRGAFISSRGNVKIGNDLIIRPNFTLIWGNRNFEDKGTIISEQGTTRKGIVVGDNCQIGANVTILDGVAIRNRAIIAAGVVVTKDVDDSSIVGGVPARLIKQR